MKAEELRKRSNEELWEIRKNLEFELMKSKSKNLAEVKSNQKLGIKFTKKGIKTSLSKELRKNIARINTILRERELKEANTNG